MGMWELISGSKNKNKNRKKELDWNYVINNKLDTLWQNAKKTKSKWEKDRRGKVWQVD